VPAPRSSTAAREAVLVALRDGAAPDALLDAAAPAGTVTHFALERPTLSDSSARRWRRERAAGGRDRARRPPRDARSACARSRS
jgi:hypothetical protein